MDDRRDMQGSDAENEIRSSGKRRRKPIRLQLCDNHREHGVDNRCRRGDDAVRPEYGPTDQALKCIARCRLRNL